MNRFHLLTLLLRVQYGLGLSLFSRTGEITGVEQPRTPPPSALRTFTTCSETEKQRRTAVFSRTASHFVNYFSELEKSLALSSCLNSGTGTSTSASRKSTRGQRSPTSQSEYTQIKLAQPNVHPLSKPASAPPGESFIVLIWSPSKSVANCCCLACCFPDIHSLFKVSTRSGCPFFAAQHANPKVTGDRFIQGQTHRSGWRTCFSVSRLELRCAYLESEEE